MFRKNGRDIILERVNGPVEKVNSCEVSSARSGERWTYCCSSSLDGSWLIFSAMRSYSIIWRRESCASSKDVLSCSICPFRASRSSSGRVELAQEGRVRHCHTPILCFSRSYCSTCRLSASHTRTAFLRVRWKDSSSTPKSSLASSMTAGSRRVSGGCNG